MVRGSWRIGLALGAVVLVAACSKSPSSPSSTQLSSVAAPVLLSPPNASQVRNSDQPITLTVQNGIVTQSGTGTYTFEVATDTGFANKVQSKTGVAQGSSGRTSVKLDALPAGADYYWHVRLDGGGTVGVFSAAFKFTVGPAISLGAPTPVYPLTGAVTAGWPSFTVTNAARQGPVGSVSYLFEISTSAAFSSVMYSSTVTETATRTTFTPPASLGPPAQTSLYWRATATDQTNGISSPASVVQNFTYTTPTRQALLAAQQGYTLWPGTQPTGTNGHASMSENGGGWDVQNKLYLGVTPFVSPTLESLQLFDLLDRGFDPQGAIDWMNRNGYRTAAVFYSLDGGRNPVIGLHYQYMALVGGGWELVDRAE
jgi:hypothetical protein